MAQTEMKSLTMKSSLPVEFALKLGNHIQTHYQESPAEYEDEYKFLSESRNMILNKTLTDEKIKDALVKYYVQIEFLELRFPIHENGIEIEFSWTDTFSQVPIVQHSLSYEKASVLFNLAAVYSSLAVSQ
eukprot:Sdes_comp10585_c0_seq1m2284